MSGLPKATTSVSVRRHEHARAHLEEILGRGVGIFDGEPLADDEQRMGQRASSASASIGWAGETRRALGFLVEPLKRCILCSAAMACSGRGCTNFMQE